MDNEAVAGMLQGVIDRVSQLEPVVSDLKAGQILAEEKLQEVVNVMLGIQSRIDQLIASHNQVGENIAWIVANTQGIFQMFSDPKLINQMMGGMLSQMGGAPNAGGKATDTGGN
jgi:hypothetical protein